MLTVNGEQAAPAASSAFAADDRVMKPVTVRALVQRLKALLRRQPSTEK